ncbi:MAG TPA: DUF2269 family protein [Micrococcaceae bacterium]|jgi:uncharacterized membrane protein|nr:DUF2269 family protein [Micrococcaceae bacterium]
METVLNVLHVVAAVFIVGPMAILPMTGMRAVRAGQGGQVATLAKSTNIFTLLSLVVVFFGFGVMGMTDKKFNLSFTTPWILISIILYVIALILSLALVVPGLRSAAERLQGTAVDGGTAAAASATKAPEYGRIAAGSGLVSLLLLAVVVLMVWKP